MKYVTSIEIDLPRARVIELYDNPDNYVKWQESLVSLELLEGEACQQGARTRLQHKMGKREVEMLETVTRREWPDLFAATYEADGVWNEAINHFTELDDGRTGWQLDTIFRCSGVMWVLTTFFPGMFKKQTRSVMESFKAFAEAEGPKEAPIVDRDSAA
jgi:hypothetical protein